MMRESLAEYYVAAHFTTIGIVSRLQKSGAASTLQQLVDYLHQHAVDVLIEPEAAQWLSDDYQSLTADNQQIIQRCDLIISVGGDGNLLGAARLAAPANIPVVGIHRGHLGFLTDIAPDEIDPLIGQILNGEFYQESRFMLRAEVIEQGKEIGHCIALNDVILTAHTKGHMLTSEIQVNGRFLCSQESDGLIIATPTGSTAYALSGGGPILHPQLNALVIVPMMPHTLSQRPIVLDYNSELTLTLPEETRVNATLHCDGQHAMSVEPGTIVKIKKAEQPLQLIHPHGYDYLTNLRGKLCWGQRFKGRSQIND
ncbi:MAG: NAD(+) kinase [Gammaproteobacteria bacterium]|nr:NAD(+) kinase [Gammaproteobacteria bacterium]